MTSGGPRQGTPGVAYENRSDLNQAVRTAPNQQYGQAGQQEAAQQAIPLPQTPAPGAQPFDRPTQNPNEPVTAGLPVGAGAGPEVLALSHMPEDDFATQARALYTKYGTEGLRRIVEIADGQ